MDIRNTLKVNETFLEILENCFKGKTKVSMLLEDNGLVRAEGIIKNLEVNIAQPYIEMQDGLIIILTTITAINGIFIASYSEC